MAGNQNSGGFRPTAPQNNPANVSATGGAGQSGRQPARYISGGTYGQGQELMAQQQGAPMAQAQVPTAGRSEAMASNLPQVTPITAPTERPDEPVTTGIAMGPGAGPEALMLPKAGDTSEDRERILSYLPALETAALSPNSSQAFRNYVRVLRANL
jgi:hypothetical protein